MRMVTVLVGLIVLAGCASAGGGSLPGDAGRDGSTTSSSVSPTTVRPAATSTTLAPTGTDPDDGSWGTAPHAEDPRFDPGLWVGAVVEVRPPDYRTVYADGVATDLASWGGGCVGEACAAEYQVVVPLGVEALDEGYPLMIWLTTSVADVGEVVPQRDVVAAESVEVPPLVVPVYECYAEGLESHEAVIGLVSTDGRQPPLWAWSLSGSKGIVPVNPAEVTCYPSGD